MATSSGGGVIGADSARRYPLDSLNFPLRFFNMLHFDIPRNLADVYKWCVKLNDASGLLSRITDTLARYPITHIQCTGDCGPNKDDWSKLLNHTISLPNELVANGKDLYSFGNCIVSIVPPFKRYLICPKCSTYQQHCINDDNFEDKPFKWKFHDYKFIGLKCMGKDIKGNKCNYSGVMEVKDEYLEGEEFIKKVKIIRWPILNIKVRDLKIAGKKKIFYKLEEKYSKHIRAGDRFTVANVPYTFILACKQGRASTVIELPADLTFHYQYENITEPEWEGLSKPFFFSAWKDIFMSFILRKAQECIASDHLVPNRFIFPTATPGGTDPLRNMDGSAWMNVITTQLKRQQNDPNEIGIVPFPLGYQALGGQGKALSLREEIELQDRRILTQLGIPPELIYGGMTWSGSNISLRMLENMFLYYIDHQNKFIQFFVDYVSIKANKQPPTEVKLSPFKMADDIQQSNLLIALGAQRRISETTSLSQVGNGINLEKEAKQMEDDANAIQRMVEARQKIDTLVQAYVNKISTIEGIDTQIAGQVEQNNAGNMTQTSMANNIVDGAIMQTVEGIVNKINALKTPQERQSVLIQLQQQSPAQYNKVIGALNGMPQDDPLPTVKPPRSGPEKAKV